MILYWDSFDSRCTYFQSYCQKDRAGDGEDWELNLKASILLCLLIGDTGARKFLLLGS